jgi:hypothetical protein
LPNFLTHPPLYDRPENKYNIGLEYNYEALYYANFAILPVTWYLLGPNKLIIIPLSKILIFLLPYMSKENV